MTIQLVGVHDIMAGVMVLKSLHIRKQQTYTLDVKVVLLVAPSFIYIYVQYGCSFHEVVRHVSDPEAETLNPAR